MRHPNTNLAEVPLEEKLKRANVYTPTYLTEGSDVLGSYDINKNGRLDKAELAGVVDLYSQTHLTSFLTRRMTCNAINGQHPKVIEQFIKETPPFVLREFMESLRTLDGRLAFPNGMAEVTLDDVKPLTNRVVQHIGDCSSNKIGR